MSARDIRNNVKLQQALTNKVITTNEISGVIDLQGFRSNLIAISVGQSGDTLSGSVKFELELRHSDDGISFANATDGDISDYVVGTNTGTFGVLDDASKDEQIYETTYIGEKRYLAIAVTTTGTHSNGTPMSLVAILGNSANLPI